MNKKNDNFPPFITYVGSGPWGRNFLTIIGAEAIEGADIILYDRYVNPDIITFFPKTSQLVDLTRARNHQTIDQADINNKILQFARSGKIVVRVTNSDPFVFNTAPEEMIFLAENGVEFNMIPGIPAAMAIPAIAGIPITHSELAPSFFVVKRTKKGGSKDTDLDLDFDFETLVKLSNKNTTLIFQIHIKSIFKTIRGLINSGLDKTTPVALITNGFSARQKKVVGTLGNISSLIKVNKVKPPSIFIVGKVVSLNETLDSHSKRPLYGVRILDTSHTDQIKSSIDFFSAVGAEVITYSCSKNMYTYENINKVFINLPLYDYFAFTTLPSVEAFIALLKARKIDFRAFINVKFAVFDNRLARLFNEICIYPELIPENPSSENLASLISQDLKNSEINEARVCFFRGNELDIGFLEALGSGLICDDVVIFHSIFTNTIQRPVLFMLKNNEIDYVIFRSPSAVYAFVKNFELENYSHITALCLGEASADIAKRYDFNIYVSFHPSNLGLVKTMMYLHSL